jgi:hypothetical protein
MIFYNLLNKYRKYNGIDTKLNDIILLSAIPEVVEWHGYTNDGYFHAITEDGVRYNNFYAKEVNEVTSPDGSHNI